MIWELSPAEVVALAESLGRGGLVMHTGNENGTQGAGEDDTGSVGVSVFRVGTGAVVSVL